MMIKISVISFYVALSKYTIYIILKIPFKCTILKYFGILKWCI